MATKNAEFLFSPDIYSQTRIKGFAEAIGQLFSGADDLLDKLKIYDFDNLNENQLDAYAQHFWVGAYQDCENATQKRALVKASGVLTKKKGTPYAVKTALELLGYTNVILHENVAVLPAQANGLYKANGWSLANGSILYDKQFFEVSADNMTGNEERAKRIIKAYKGGKDYLLQVYNN